MRLLRRTLAVSVLGAVCFLVPLGTSSGAVRDGTSSAHMAVAQQQCSDSQYSGTRDPANPLELSPAPGSDPLSGAHLFVDGPRHGVAAGAIAQLLGVDPQSYP